MKSKKMKLLLIRWLLPWIVAAFFSASHFPVMGQEAGPDQVHWLTFNSGSGTGPGTGKHIVLIAGDDEYRSEEAMPMLAKILSVHHGFKCSVLFPVNDQGIIQPDFQTNIPGMHRLASADAIVLGLRFRNLPDSDMRHFVDYVESGKPIIGLRTSTHAFQIPKDRKYAKFSWDHEGENWTGGFGRRVLGDTWISHHGDHGKQSTRGIANDPQRHHPVLRGVEDVWGPSDVYAIRNLPKSATVLLHGQVLAGMNPSDAPAESNQNDPMMPLAWVHRYPTESGIDARIFCTTMGAATDFKSMGLRRLIVNAVFWSTGLEEEIRSDLNVDCVDEFKPTAFGFKSYRRDMRPTEYGLSSSEK